MIYTVNSSKNCVEVALFRAYIRRKPSGLLLVTVLSTLLPRPVFRTYPREIGEAAAVERSVGHALALLPTVNVVVAEPLHRALPGSAEQGDKRNDEGNKQCDSESGEKLKRLELNPQIKGFHSSPHGLHQPCNQAAVRSEEQEGAGGYAVKQHLRLRVVWQGLL